MHQQIIRLALSVLLLSCAMSAHAGWHIRTTSSGAFPKRTHLQYSSTPTPGFPTLSAALNALNQRHDSRQIDNIGLTSLLWNPAFQSELFTCLDRLSPETLAAALRSSGNLQ